MVSMLFLKKRGMGAPMAAAFSIMLPISASRYHTATIGRNSAPGKNGSVPCGRFAAKSCAVISKKAAAKSISSAPHFFHSFSRAVFEAHTPCFRASTVPVAKSQHMAHAYNSSSHPTQPSRAERNRPPRQ